MEEGSEIEAQTNLPPFLIPRVLADWRRENSQPLKERDQRRSGLKIGHESIPDGEEVGNMGRKYSFSDVNSKIWQIFVPKNPESFQDAHLNLERLCQELEIRQTFPEPKTRQEETRQKAQDFLAANWGQLWQIFYSQEEERNQATQVFSNVGLDKLGIVDLITIGPDGKIFIFNINQPMDRGQVEKYKQALISLARDLGLSIRDIRVFAALPSFSANANTLIVTEDK